MTGTYEEKRERYEVTLLMAELTRLRKINEALQIVVQNQDTQLRRLIEDRELEEAVEVSKSLWYQES